MSLRTWCLIGSMFLLACDGCERNRISRAGDNERLTFSYAATDGRSDPNRAIALGADLVVQVTGPNDQQLASMTSITTTSERVLTARELARDQLVLAGVGEGEATLEVEALLRNDASRLRDTLSFRVARPVQMSLAHTCTTERSAAYVVSGRDIELEYARFERDGRRLLGRGACDISIEDTREMPEAEALLAGALCDESTLKLPSPGVPGTLKVSANLGAPRDRFQEITVERVAFEKLDFEPVQESIEVGTSRSIQLDPQTDLWPICTNLRMRVEILTPGVCEGPDFDEIFFVQPEDRNRVRLRARDIGTCLFQVTVPELDPETAWEFTVDVFEDED